MRMWFKRLLSWLFRRDFTARPLTEEEQAVVDEMEAKVASGEVAAPQYWSSDCNWLERFTLLSAHPSIRHFCCDGALSSVENRRYACVGHYGVCCSK